MSAKPSPSPLVSAWVGAVHLAVLWGFAVAQPIYDLLAQYGTLLAAHRLRPGELLALVGVLSFLAPGVLAAGAGVLGWLHRRAGELALATLVGALSALVALAPLKRIVPELGPVATIVIAAASGALFATLYARVRSLRSFLTLLSPSILVFPAVFLFWSPARAFLGMEESPSSAGRGSGGRPIPIVLLVFDELSLVSLTDVDGSIDRARFPHLARLASRGWWFPRATAAASTTYHAIPAIVTGRYPPEDKYTVPAAAAYPDNLFTWLGQERTTRAVESMTMLCPPTICEPPAEGGGRRDLARDIAVVFLHVIVPEPWADLHLPPLDAAWKGFEAPKEPIGITAIDSEEAVAELRKRRINAVEGDRGDVFRAAIRTLHERDSLTFVHTLLPHIPWEHLTSGRRYTYLAQEMPKGVVNEVWSEDPAAVINGYHQYLVQVGFVDRLVGDVVDHLESSGLYDDALLIVTADHGVSFMAGGPRRALTEQNAPEIVRVPLLVKLPFQETGQVSQRVVSSVDILPTIADVLGIAVPWEIDGHSVFSPRYPERDRVRVGTEELDLAVVFGEGLHPWQRSLFTRREPLSNLVQRGPHHDALVNRAVGDLGVEPTPDGILESEDVLVFRGAASTPHFVPARLRGDVVVVQPREDVAVAVAVNGVIRATVRAAGRPGKTFSLDVLLPESAFSEPTNKVELFTVQERMGILVLHPLPWVGDRPIRIVAGGPAGVEELREEGRGQWPVQQRLGAGIRYALDRMYVRDDVVGLVGWVGDTERQVVAERLFFTVGGIGLHAGTPTIERPSVAKAFGERLLVSGYAFEIPANRLRQALGQDPDLDTLRFFALVDGELLELTIPSGYKVQLANEVAGRSNA